MSLPKIAITHDGQTQSLTAWAHALGVSRQTLHARLQRYPDDLDRVLISGKKGVGRSINTIPKLDGLTEIINETYSEIQVEFSSGELERIRRIKAQRVT